MSSAKNKIRRMMLDRRQALSANERREKSLKIAEKLEFLKVFQVAQQVLFYYAVQNEVETRSLLEEYRDKKNLYLPVIPPGQNDFWPASFRTPFILKKGGKGIPEPQVDDLGLTYEISLDLIIVPGVAFTPSGSRLGMGKGFYDRFLIHYPKIFKIGLAFQEQILENLPQDPYDVPVDLIITDQKIYQCH